MMHVFRRLHQSKYFSAFVVLIIFCMSRNLLERATHPGKSHKNGSEIPEYGWKTNKITFPIFERSFQEFTPSDMPQQYDFLAAPKRSPLWPYFLFFLFLLQLSPQNQLRPCLMVSDTNISSRYQEVSEGVRVVFHGWHLSFVHIPKSRNEMWGNRKHCPKLFVMWAAWTQSFTLTGVSFLLLW